MNSAAVDHGEKSARGENRVLRKLGELASFRTGPFGSALHKSDYIADGVPVINPMHIVDGRLVPTPGMTVTDSAARGLQEFRLSAGDVVIGRRGDMGRCALVRQKHAGWLCGTGSMIVRPQRGLEAAYCQLVLSSPAVVAAIENSSVGSTMINLNQRTLAGLCIDLPAPAEQRAIAATLSDADELIDGLGALISKKRDLRQAAMQQLLTGKRRLPSFGGSWQTAGLGTLFVFTGGFPASREQLSSSGHCYLHYGDIHLSTKSYVDVCAEGDQIPRLDVDLGEVGQGSLLRDGDVVFVDASEDDEGASKHVVVENAGNLPYISGLHTIVARSRGDHLDKLFKRYCFQSRRVKEQFKFYAVGTKVSGISKSNIAKIELTFPTSGEEQRAIANVLTDMDTEIAGLVEQRDKLHALKQGMVQQLLTGRIRLI